MRYLAYLALVCGVAAQTQSVVSIVPSDGATGVPLNARIIVAASFGSYFQMPLKVTKGGTAVSGSTQIGGSPSDLMPPPFASGWFVFTPDTPLDPQTTYAVEFDSPLSAPFFASFSTGAAADHTPLQLVSSDPLSGQDGVSTMGSVTLHFNKPVNPFSVQPGQFTVSDLSSGISGYLLQPQAQPDGATLVFNMNLSLGHAYQFQFPATGVTDWLGNPLSPVPGAITFTTFRTAEKAGPVSIGTAPANGDTGIALNSRIVLAFDKPLAQIPWDSAVTLDSGGPLKFTLDNTVAGGRALVIQPALLMPPNSKVSLKVSGLLDLYGAPLTAPINISFHTGTAVETRPLLLSVPVNVPLAQNDAIQATFNRAIDPLMLSLGGVQLHALDDYTDFVEVPSTLSADHRTVSLKPSSPLPAGTYYAYISVPFDRTAGKLQPFTMSFTMTGDTDTTPPKVLALTPPDGTKDAPVTSLIQVTFSEPVIAGSASTVPFQLLKNGQPVAGAFSLNGSMGTFLPVAPLDPSTVYRISVTSLTDLAGNRLAAFSASFTTSAGNPPSNPFQVSTVSPAAGAIATPSAKIVLTFNREIDPVSLDNQYLQVRLNPEDFYSLTVPGQVQAHGAVLTFTPSSPLEPGTYDIAVGSITDLAGKFVTPFYSSFEVAGPLPNSTPPSVISVSPGDGQPVLFLNPYVVFTFSKAIDPTTLKGSNIAAYGPGGYISVTTTVLADDTQVAVTFSASPGTLITLLVTPGVLDFSGNPAVPFRTTVRMSDKPLSTGAAVVLQRPGPYASTNVPPNTGLTLLFSAPVDRASVEQGLLVTANGNLVSGTVAWSPDSMGLTFLSSSPYPYSSTVGIALVYPSKDAAGNDLSYSSFANASMLTIAAAPPAPPASLAVIASNLPPPFGPSPLDSVIELQFNQDVPANLGVGTLTDNSTSGPTKGQVLSCTATLIRPRVIRFTPQTLLQPSALYTFNFDSGSGLQWSNFMWTGTAVSTSNNPYVLAAGPVDRSVALNAQITVAFPSAVAEFLMPGALTLQTGGTIVSTRYSWSAGDRALTLTPLALLHAASDYTVTMTGFEDLAGHSIPDRTWTFHTSSAIDLQPPAVVFMQPSGDDISANAGIAVAFSKPVAADWIDQFQVGEGGEIGGTPVGGSTVNGTALFSADQRTLFFTPAQPLAAGHFYTISVPLVDDFAGNVQNNPPSVFTTTTFRTAFQALSAPKVVLATPDNGSSQLPLNVQFQTQFDQPVLASSLDGVALFENNVALPATVRVEADGQTVTALPQRLPAAGSTVKFIVASVKNTTGVAMTGQYQASVKMGTAVDTTPPAFLSSPGNGQSEVPLNTQIRVRFHKPLNKLTVNASTVVLGRSPFSTLVDASVSLQDSGRTLVITPTVALSKDTSYFLSLGSVSDLSGNPVNTNFSSLVNDVNFSTSSGLTATPPVLLAFDPPDGSQNVPPNPNIQIVYSQPVDLTLGDNSLQLLSGTAQVPGTVGGTGSQLTFTPSRPLADGTYRVQTSGIADVTGHPIDPVSSTFKVGAPTVGSPNLVSSTPADGAVGVAVNSTIALNFNETVSSVSVAKLQVTFQNSAIPGLFRVKDSVVTFTPANPLPGAAKISVTGSVMDLWDEPAEVFLSFTTGANSDKTPPKLVFAYPAQGAVVPAYGTNIVLQFSKPVIAPFGTSPFQVLTGSSPITSNYEWTVGEDGRTFVNDLNLPPDADITVAITSALLDFAGNAIRPVSIQFRTASDVQSRGPQILSVSPANGAVNVKATTPIVLQFSSAMAPVSVDAGLQVTDAGVTIPGSTSDDSSAKVFTFRPATSYQTGSTVELFTSPSIFDVTGSRIAAFYSHFETLGPQASAAQAVSFSASANAIDLRFSGPVPANASQAYLRQGMTLVPSEVVATGVDQIRVIPASPLYVGVVYHLVLDASQELAIQVEKEFDDGPGAITVIHTPGAIRMKFSQPVNPLTVLRGGIKLLGADGATVDFTTRTSVDRTEMLLAPATLAGPLTLVIDGVESRAGRRFEPQIVR